MVCMQPIIEPRSHRAMRSEEEGRRLRAAMVAIIQICPEVNFATLGVRDSSHCWSP